MPTGLVPTDSVGSTVGVAALPACPVSATDLKMPLGLGLGLGLGLVVVLFTTYCVVFRKRNMRDKRALQRTHSGGRWQCRRHAIARHDAFLSYRVLADGAMVQTLVAMIESQPRATERGDFPLMVFLDRNCLVASEVRARGEGACRGSRLLEAGRSMAAAVVSPVALTDLILTPRLALLPRSGSLPSCARCATAVSSCPSSPMAR